MPFDWLTTPVKTIDNSFRERALARQAILTKPAGALGELESIAIKLAALQANDRPSLDRIHITVFAADHGIAEESVSAFPQAVTVEMIRNFASGGAAISVLARELGATLEVVNMGTVTEPEAMEGVYDHAQGKGTQNFSVEAAMSMEQLAGSLDAGRQVIERARMNKADIFIGGEMGIANTTSATAIACALLKLPAALMSGPGTGLNTEAVAHKASVITRALDHHGGQLEQPLEILRRLGGYEIVALTGSYLAAAQTGLPVLVDGYIASVAALMAVTLQQDVSNWLLFAHASAEPGHKMIMEALHARPLLDLSMRLGEGSGAAIAVPILRQACALHNQMASFADAHVSQSYV